MFIGLCESRDLEADSLSALNINKSDEFSPQERVQDSSGETFQDVPVLTEPQYSSGLSYSIPS